MAERTPTSPPSASATPTRRRWIGRASSWAMTAGLVGGYGALAVIAGRFLFPARPAPRRWIFVAEADRMDLGDSLLYRGPSGETINVTRQSDGGTNEDFVALSSTCPHLGCQVHWESQNNRYFCPCHSGAFDAAGRGIEGPPGDAGMELPRYPLKVERGLLYLELPVETLTADARGEVIDRVEGIHGPGHDPCLTRVHPPATGEPKA